MAKLKMITLLGVVALVCIVTGCSSSEDSPPSTLLLPEDTGDGLQVGDPVEFNFEVSLLEDLKTANLDGRFTNTHSILIAKDNQLIYEEYFSGSPIYGNSRNWNKNIIHNQHSVTKSWNSALIGIAVDQYGLSVNDRLIDLFPDLTADVYWEGAKSELTVEDLLTMSSGHEWDEWTYSYDDPRNDHIMMNVSDNWVAYVLSRPLVAAPGDVFVYNSGLSITLGEIVKRASGKSVEQFANDHLFGPLGIDSYAWVKSDNQIYQTGGGLSLKPRAMMKLGLLFLNEGNWNGQQIISKEWVNTSTSQHGPNNSYGYQWWITSYSVFGAPQSAYLASGRGGQYIIVMPQHELVVVFTAGNDNNLALTQEREMMQGFILPSFL